MSDPATPLRCPYVGLQPYTEADIDYFFGRERDQRIIAANLGAARLTILYGASGVGKSSVLLAGVVPSLRARPRTAVAVVRDWRGPGFLDALKSECRQAVERALQEPLSIDSRLPLDEFLEAAGQALRGSLLIIFDQFEEYFLYHPESETDQTFDAELARAVNRDDVDASFLFVMREDGLAKLDRFGGRIPNLLSNTLRLQHLTAPDAEAAIRKPLDVFNERHTDAAPIAIEDALVDAIIGQVGSGQVALSRSGGVGQADGTDETGQIEAPFLQLVMTRLWEVEVNSGSRTLRLATLKRLGGAEKIVRMHLDEVMDGLDGARQEVCAKFFDRLVTPSGTKIACGIRDLADWAGPSSGEVAPILETLCASRILRGVAIPGARRQSDSSYEIYNDVLAPAILDWRRGYLQAQERVEAERRAAEQAQTEAKAKYAKWIKTLGAALAVLLVVAFVGTIIYQQQLNRATDRLNDALNRRAHARELAAAAQNILDPNPELGTRLAIEAVRATSLADGSMTDAAFNVLHQIVHAPRAEKQLSGLGGTPRTMFFTPDGSRLVVTGSRPGTITWDAATGSPMPTMVDEKAVSALAFSPDGQRFAAADSHGAVMVLDAVSGKELFTVVHDGVVTAAVFSPHGERLATASVDGAAKISDAGSGNELFTLVGQGSPDAKWLAVEGQNQTVTVRNAGTSSTEPFKKSVPEQSVVTTLMFNANGNRLVTLSRENVTVWEVPSGKIFSLAGQYNAVAVSPNGNFLAAGEDRWVHLWNVTSAERADPLPILCGHTDSVLDVVFSLDSKRIATASTDDTARIWSVESGTELLSLKGAKGSVAKVVFGPDGTQLATAGDEGTVSLWNIGSHAAAAKRVAFSADGRRLATSGADGMVKIWDVDTRRALGTPLGPQSGDIYGLAFSADGSRLVTASSDKRATVWDLKTYRPRFGDIPTDLTGSIDLVLPEDGTLVIAGGEGVAKVWDREGNFSRAFGRPESADAVALSGDGQHLATVNQNRHRLEIWDDRMKDSSWSISSEVLDSDKDLFQDVVFSPNGRYAASVSQKGVMQLWDVRSKTLVSLPADYLARDNVSAENAMAFSPDGARLAAAYPKTVVVWDIAKRENAEFIIHVAGVNTLAFSSDGKRLATASGDDGTFQVWRLTAEDLMAQAAKLTNGRTLSEDECKIYHIEPCLKSN